MKHNKCIVGIMLFLYFLLFPFQISAHPGRTDANGGHFDSDTGEYHYHHGYPAHEHYDVNGDGIIDCPYDFKDNTSDNSRGEAGNTNDNHKYPQIINNKSKKVEEVPIWLVALFFCGTLFFSLYSVYLRSKISKLKNDNTKLRKSFSNERDILNSEFEKSKKKLEGEFHNDLQKIADTYENNFNDDIIRALANVPEGDYLDHNLLPVSEGGCDRWGSKYTFFLSSTKKFHVANCRYTKTSHSINAYTVHQRGYERCSICKPNLPDVSWVDRYKEYQSLFNKYHVTTPKRKHYVDNSETR